MEVSAGAGAGAVMAAGVDAGVATTGSGRVEDRTGVVSKWGLAGRSVEEEEEEEGGGTVARTRVGADWPF
jgi:hypothetical protein